MSEGGLDELTAAREEVQALKDALAREQEASDRARRSAVAAADALGRAEFLRDRAVSELRQGGRIQPRPPSPARSHTVARGGSSQRPGTSPASLAIRSLSPQRSATAARWPVQLTGAVPHPSSGTLPASLHP
eukprot:Hpha_TRINITY_DN16700_c3_g5::TRINITY_DN16700_c3_g5_i1::g.79170::m.79170